MYTKKQPISKLKSGERIEDIFVVKIKKSLVPYKNKAGLYFALVLSDSTGRSIDYKYWGGESEEKTAQIYESIKSDSVVFVKGKAELYEDKLQISTNFPDTIMPLADGEFDPKDFIGEARRDVNQMVADLYKHVGGIKNADIKRLLEKVFVSDKEFLDRFKVHPASIEIHHNWTGGLLQHILEVARYLELTSELYPEMDRDLMIAGALLHDIGKVDELASTTRIKGTTGGQLKGHIALGYRQIANLMDELKTDPIIRDKILHIILSHHGLLEFGSPKEPMFPEAVAVHYADQMSSKFTELIDFVNSAKEATQDDFMYNKRHGKIIFLR